MKKDASDDVRKICFSTIFSGLKLQLPDYNQSNYVAALIFMCLYLCVIICFPL